jgi:hypothetical protein
MLLVADHSFLVTQRWDIQVGTSQGPRTLITLKCLDTSILNTNKNHLITLTVDGKPAVRILIPVRGAGDAQRSFVYNLVAALAPMVKFGKVQLLLNAGDHAHLKQAFEEVLRQVDLEYSIVPDMAGVKK